MALVGTVLAATTFFMAQPSVGNHSMDGYASPSPPLANTDNLASGAYLAAAKGPTGILSLPKSAVAKPAEQGMDQTEVPLPDVAAGYTVVPFQNLTSEALSGARVYDSTGQDIGEVHEILFAESTVEAVLIDVGGLLGVGERRIALPMQNLAIMHNVDLGTVLVIVNATQDNLEDLPSHE